MPMPRIRCALCEARNVLSAMTIDAEERDVPLLNFVLLEDRAAEGLPGVGENRPSISSRPCSSLGRGATLTPVTLNFVSLVAHLELPMAHTVPLHHSCDNWAAGSCVRETWLSPLCASVRKGMGR